MRREELAFAIDLAVREDWNPGLLGAECFRGADPTAPNQRRCTPQAGDVACEAIADFDRQIFPERRDAFLRHRSRCRWRERTWFGTAKSFPARLFAPVRHR
jgi:hypothetical protein